MTFLVQFRFAESKNVLPALPGDVFLVFVRNEELAWYIDDYHFEWYRLGLTDLVRQEDIPTPSWRFVRCYGVRHRTVDFKDLDIARKRLANLVAERPFNGDLAVSKITWLDGLKIAGIPSWNDFDDLRLTRVVNKTFLCSLSSICPTTDTPFPWVNVPTPIPSGTWNPDNMLYLMDGFCLYFFIENGEVAAILQSR